MCLVFVYPQRLNTASMGLCPFRHGYNSEINPARTAHRCFNGAMPFQAWICPTSTRPSIGTRRFNGAMPFQAWISERIAPHEERRNYSFNGAMPFQAWIYLGLRLDFPPLVTLQWGHALSGMDMVYQRHSAASGRRCFNGAMPFQAWIYCCPRLCSSTG